MTHKVFTCVIAYSNKKKTYQTIKNIQIINKKANHFDTIPSFSEFPKMMVSYVFHCQTTNWGTVAALS